MDPKINKYLSLEKEFSNRGYFLYLVGGTVRDYLLGKELSDMDIVTNATPIEMKEFLIDADYSFEKYGSVRVKVDGDKFDITTLRKESGYSDSRHPNKIEFTDKLDIDVYRRDLTINALYMDKNLKVIDLVGGVSDLNNKVIRMIGDPVKRIIEDPLRIVRIYRFQLETGFNIEAKTLEAMNSHLDLLKKLNKDKIIQEVKKSSSPNDLIKILKSCDINLE